MRRSALCMLPVLLALLSAAAHGDNLDAAALPAGIEAQLQAICDVAATEGSRVGLAVLFVGDDLAAKTAAAEFIARALGRDLYRIDLADVVSEYVHETEVNLRQVFEAAEALDVIRLFDEADELFGKRSDVRDSQDRYANLETLFDLATHWDPHAILILSVCCLDLIEGEVLPRFLDVVPFPADEDGSEEGS